MDAEWSAALPPELRQKLRACREGMARCGSIVVGFSAGVDSTFLLALAAETLGAENVLAAMAVSPSLPDRERKEGRALTERLGVELVEVVSKEMDDARYAANPPDRCFYCKHAVFGELKALAERRGFAAVAAGANADDTGDFRPGLRAARQLGVVSPLLEAGLTKGDVRAASKAMGLPTWDKPAMACLASRVPYGERITAAKLSRIERAEALLHELGFRECRAREHGTIARIEVPPAQFTRLCERREQIVGALKNLGFTYITLDLQGFRSGSMNETLDLGDE